MREQHLTEDGMLVVPPSREDIAGELLRQTGGNLALIAAQFPEYLPDAKRLSRRRDAANKRLRRLRKEPAIKIGVIDDRGRMQHYAVRLKPVAPPRCTPRCTRLNPRRRHAVRAAARSPGREPEEPEPPLDAEQRP